MADVGLTVRLIAWWNEYYRQAGGAVIAQRWDDPVILRFGFIRWLREDRHVFCDEECCVGRGRRPPLPAMRLPPSWEAR